MKKVYIAGKYNDDDIIKCLANIKLGIQTAVKAIHDGYIPFCPFLDFMFYLVGEKPLTVEEFKAYSMEWVESCDEIWVLPNWETSGGTKREIEKAQIMDIRVRYL